MSELTPLDIFGGVCWIVIVWLVCLPPSRDPAIRLKEWLAKQSKKP